MQIPGSEWQGRSGDSWAAEWKRTDRSFGQLTERLLQCTRGSAFREVIDVGCGAGELSLALARGRPGARVTGVDISSQLVDVARGRGAHLPNAQFVVADAATWRPAEMPADLLVSRHGVMFFADPVAAFDNLHACAAPDAAMLFSCFRAPALNPFLTEVARLLPPPAQAPDPHAPGPFALADSERVEAILREAGWRDIGFEPFDFAMIVGAGEDPVGDAVGYFHAIGPAARADDVLDAAGMERFQADLRGLVESHCREGVVALRASAWIVQARRG